MIDYSVKPSIVGSSLPLKSKLANKWNWDRKTVRKFLTLLQQEEMILKTHKKMDKYNLINWDKYQLDGQEVGQEVGGLDKRDRVGHKQE